jgi:hypothetical protein
VFSVAVPPEAPPLWPAANAGKATIAEPHSKTVMKALLGMVLLTKLSRNGSHPCSRSGNGAGFFFVPREGFRNVEILWKTVVTPERRGFPAVPSYCAAMKSNDADAGKKSFSVFGGLDWRAPD